MAFIVMLLVLISISIFVFIISHLEVLTRDEIEEVTTAIWLDNIKNRFEFNKGEYIIDNNFRKYLRSWGKYYEIDETLFSLPSVIAELLRYKRHEWIVVAFEKGQKINKVWINKGVDENSVTLRFKIQDLIEEQEEVFSSILVFHNHPCPHNSSEYELSKPSEQDIETANVRFEILSEKNLNYIEFICVKGKYYPYYMKICKKQYPIAHIEDDIMKLNGQSKYVNLKLHCKKVFLPKTETGFNLY
jgi:hypothetical protein